MATLSIHAVRKKYLDSILNHLNNLKETLRFAGWDVDDIEEIDDEEYGWRLAATKGIEQICFELWILEAAVREPAGDQFGINFGLTSMDGEGAPIGSMIPYNYSESVWVSRKDPEAVQARWSEFANAFDEHSMLDAVEKHFCG